MSQRTPPDDLDLLAYADGLLDADPTRREAVEQALRSSPGAMARARAFRQQTDELRAAYAHRLADPVPDRLSAVLERGASRARATAWRAAAVLCLALGAGVGGWLVGHEEDRGWSAARFVERSYAQFTQPDGAAPGEALIAGGTNGQPAGPAGSAFSLGLPSPDLSELGYEVVDRRSITVDSARIRRLDYAAPDGRAFSLFMAPRWEPRPVEIAQAERDGVSLAHWLDGPLAATVIARMPPAATRRLAEILRGRMGRDGSAVVQAEVPASRTDVLADTVPAPLQPSNPPILDAREDGG